jgi:hypothetical protein
MDKPSNFRNFICLMFVLMGTACSHVDSPQNKIKDNNHLANDLAKTIHALSNEVTLDEANETSQILIEVTSTLVSDYDVKSSSLFHNVLVNTGVKKRGLCCHWAEDLYQELHKLNVSSLKFDWLVSRLGSKLREHNTIVIYASDSNWQKGIVYDPWRKAGKPYWIKVVDDKYPWIRHPLSGQWDLLRCK